MSGRTGRRALVITWLSLALPITAWAGSSQASLAIGVVVPARCAVRVPGSLATIAPGAVAVDSVAMRYTKGTLPSTAGVVGSTAVAPQITRDLVAATASATAAPRPLSEPGSLALEAPGAHLVITVNF